jgi:hypothetical protein
MAGEILPRDIIFGLIIFTLFITGIVTFLGDLGNNMPQNTEFLDTNTFNSFNNSANRITDIQREVGELRGGVENADTDFGLFGVLNSLISSSWQTLRLLLDSFDFVGEILTNTSNVFGIPTWVASMVILLITVVIIFGIFSAIFQREI